MVKYLYKITPLNKDFKAKGRMDILVATINKGMYDIALQMLKSYGSIVTSPDVEKGKALQALARRPLSQNGTFQERLCGSLARIVPYVPLKKILRSSYVRKETNVGQTPRELFTDEHDKLREAGEKWMKDTATSCMLVATLIATVA
ncbi:ankyrin repeat-containing NPR4-like [Olea europaea subsp. europaea]|uniref:Ankyrin repeat-containing NPR4-like n=1 Tax=Olea europaea subsp. europaea TaxID=158383 RepID=A0A8S0PSB5_OLEEU|nr:ankyrin repeat-containing NPR4-like [Olea europaea subsp. europaea]